MNPRFLVVLCLALTALLSPGPSFAQPQPAPPASPSDLRADLSFPGGTVQQYVDAVGKAFGSANAGVFPGSEALKASPVHLKQVTRDEALHLLHALTGGMVTVQARGDVFGIFPQPGPPRELTRQIRVWPLAKVLSQMKPDEALSAVKAGLDLAGEGAEVKFHPDTTLLIISGTGAQIDAASQVVERLENVAGWRESEKERAERPKTGEADALIAGLHTQLQLVMQERDLLNDRVHSLEKELHDLTHAAKNP